MFVIIVSKQLSLYKDIDCISLSIAHFVQYSLPISAIVVCSVVGSIVVGSFSKRRIYVD